MRAEADTDRWSWSGTVRGAEGTVEGGWGGDQGLCRNWGWWGGVGWNVAEDMGLGWEEATRVRMGRGDLARD